MTPALLEAFLLQYSFEEKPDTLIASIPSLLNMAAESTKDVEKFEVDKKNQYRIYVRSNPKSECRNPGKP